MYPLEVQCKKQVQKALQSIPRDKAIKLLEDVDLIIRGLPPINGNIDTLQSIDSKVKEIRINGRPAYRLVYVIEGGSLTILHVFKKTANGRDKENLDTVRERFKSL